MCAMVFVPLLSCMFFLSLLTEGLPLQVPTAVVDLDHSPMSRAMIRSLDSEQLVHITEDCESYTKAMEAVKQGRAFGFYVIPANFQEDAIAGRKPTIDYYSNMSYFVPGTFSYKGYKTIAVTAAAGLVSKTATSKGVDQSTVMALIQPVVIDTNPVHNPWTNYSLYLTPSFSAGVLGLMIVLVTIFSITYEIKLNTSRRWLAKAGNSIIIAVTGKLLPQTVVFGIVGVCMLSMLFGYAGFPIYCSIWVMILAMILFVIACQAFGLFIASVVPNPRMGMSVGALISILAFSLTGFSFPVESMYGALASFSYIIPVRWYYLIFVNQALNGFDIYYARLYFVALLIFPLVSTVFLWRLKRACKHPVYVS
jgi:ABC-2 type transport system permease protein